MIVTSTAHLSAPGYYVSLSVEYTVQVGHGEPARRRSYPYEQNPGRSDASVETYISSDGVVVAMSTKTVLQVVTVGMIAIGLLGITSSYVPTVPFFWPPEEALVVGAGFLTIGVLMFADLRRRNWGETPPGETV